MELPREEMEVVEPVARWRDDFDVDTFDDADLADQSATLSTSPVPTSDSTNLQAKVMTAADLVNDQSEKLPPADPEIFELAMVVTHPEYGLGKIVALSGSRDKRTASVQFAGPAGEKKFRLAFSKLRPASKPR